MIRCRSLGQIALILLPLLSFIVFGCFPATPKTVITPSASRVSQNVLTSPTGPVFLARSTEEAKGYAGDQACATCHDDIAHQYHGSDHERSLRVVTAKDYGTVFKIKQTVSDPLTDTTYTPTIDKGIFGIRSDGPGGKDLVTARFALGSARDGQSYLGEAANHQWYVLRLSYFTHIHGWDFTPQQKPDIVSFAPVEGEPITVSRVGDCLGCHATVLPLTQDGPDVTHSHFGVGCESCHGPGAAHIASVLGTTGQNGTGIVKMEDLKKASAVRIMQICGGCHSTVSGMRSASADHPEEVVRFAATALAESACFKGSGTLSCVTCHSPHTNLTHDVLSYEATCKRCHEVDGPEAHKASTASARIRVCPVNPRNGCIDCHMPKQEHFSFPHMQFHNHWIKVWRKQANQVQPSTRPIT
jgi:hypothetical protein